VTGSTQIRNGGIYNCRARYVGIPTKNGFKERIFLKAHSKPDPGHLLHCRQSLEKNFKLINTSHEVHSRHCIPTNNSKNVPHNARNPTQDAGPAHQKGGPGFHSDKLRLHYVAQSSCVDSSRSLNSIKFRRLEIIQGWQLSCNWKIIICPNR
jgi:hypothetical protein